MHDLEKYLTENPGKLEGIKKAIETRTRLNTLKAGGRSADTARSIKEERAAVISYESKKLWSELGNIPVNENEEIETQFEHFEPGTDIFEIWQWFEKEFNISVAKDLMYTSNKI